MYRSREETAAERQLAPSANPVPIFAQESTAKSGARG